MFWLWVVLGAGAQIAATMLMLMAMGERSFVVTIAYIKTEPVQVALFGLLFLGDKLTLAIALAILIATAGVIVMSLSPGTARPTICGRCCSVFSAARCSPCRRSAIAARSSRSNIPTSSWRRRSRSRSGLVLQAASLSAFLAWRDMEVLRAIFRAWKPSLLAGFMGAFASQFWFLAFAIATAASVRTLALVEVLMAQAVSNFIFKQPTTPREAVGIVMIVIGVVVLVWAH